MFIEGFVNKELKEEDLVANLNVTSSFTIFIDVLFFMLTQKCYEIHAVLIQAIYRYRSRLNIVFLMLQLATITLIFYFGIKISSLILIKIKVA